MKSKGIESNNLENMTKVKYLDIYFQKTKFFYSKYRKPIISVILILSNSVK